MNSSSPISHPNLKKTLLFPAVAVAVLFALELPVGWNWGIDSDYRYMAHPDEYNICMMLFQDRRIKESTHLYAPLYLIQMQALNTLLVPTDISSDRIWRCEYRRPIRLQRLFSMAYACLLLVAVLFTYGRLFGRDAGWLFAPVVLIGISPFLGTLFYGTTDTHNWFWVYLFSVCSFWLIHADKRDFKYLLIVASAGIAATLAKNGYYLLLSLAVMVFSRRPPIRLLLLLAATSVALLFVAWCLLPMSKETIINGFLFKAKSRVVLANPLTNMADLIMTVFQLTTLPWLLFAWNGYKHADAKNRLYLLAPVSGPLFYFVFLAHEGAFFERHVVPLLVTLMPLALFGMHKACQTWPKWIFRIVCAYIALSGFSSYINHVISPHQRAEERIAASVKGQETQSALYYDEYAWRYISNFYSHKEKRRADFPTLPSGPIGRFGLGDFWNKLGFDLRSETGVEKTFAERHYDYFILVGTTFVSGKEAAAYLKGSARAKDILMEAQQAIARGPGSGKLELVGKVDPILLSLESQLVYRLLGRSSTGFSGAPLIVFKKTTEATPHSSTQ